MFSVKLISNFDVLFCDKLWKLIRVIPEENRIFVWRFTIQELNQVLIVAVCVRSSAYSRVDFSTWTDLFVVVIVSSRERFFFLSRCSGSAVCIFCILLRIYKIL